MVKKRESRSARGYDTEWYKFRKRYLAINPYCECGVFATEIDHILALSKGGAKYDPDNLKPQCKSCHSKKTYKEDTPK